jgi:HAD superfamily hydrolase (TIGR01484 family)
MSSSAKTIRTVSCIQQATPEQEFYAHYEWCLNPVLTTRELLQRLNEELLRLDSVPTGWQADECRLNLYLFVCAVACTVDDYLLPQGNAIPWLGRRIPLIKAVSGRVQRALGPGLNPSTHAANRRVLSWRNGWHALVDLACRLLVADSEERAQVLGDLRTTIAQLARPSHLPDALLAARMQLVSGYRNQDLTHYDVVAMARKFHACYKGPRHGLAVIGLRSAGAYFAPLVKAYLDLRGWQHVCWTSFRPKGGFSAWEYRQIRNVARRCLPVLIVDDHPDTGHTLRLALEMLGTAGLAPGNVTMLVPGHPAQRDLANCFGNNKPAKLLVLEFNESFKVRWLQSETIGPLLREYLPIANPMPIRLHEKENTARLNGSFKAAMSTSFQTRIKRAIDTGLDYPARVIGKSVGWGWLGYHAYIAGSRLDGFVPRALGLRNGVLFSEFIEGKATGKGERPGPDAVASYLARRHRTMRLDCDPYIGVNQVDSAWQLMAAQLRAAYGRYACRFKAGAVRGALQQYCAPLPLLTDGSMRPEEWLKNEGRWYKTDFEHRGFGNPSLGAVDPAHDLAAAIFELGMWQDEGAEQQLVADYVRHTGDIDVERRLVLHKLLYGKVVEEGALYRLLPGHSVEWDRETWNRRYLDARNFLALNMSRFCGLRIPHSAPAGWTDRGFFMDLDGVFDCEILGFPHTTAAGIEALSILRQAGYSVVINTGRSVAHLRMYCRHYGIPGAIGEFGSVFLDAVSGRELVFVDQAAREQLRQCRHEIQSLQGVFLDETYEHLLRAYRYRGSRTAGLSNEELSTIVDGFDKLRFIRREADSYILAADVNKGSALRAVCDHLRLPTKSTVCIGDSVHDVAMMNVVSRAYSPQNCSRAVKDFGRSGGCRILRQPGQRGLLAAARELAGKGLVRSSIEQPARDRKRHLLDHLLTVADRSPSRQMASILTWWSL